MDMSYYRGRLLKRIGLPDGGRVEILARKDGHYQFFHRLPGEDRTRQEPQFESAVYISVEAAEAAARRKFKL